MNKKLLICPNCGAEFKIWELFEAGCCPYCLFDYPLKDKDDN